MQSETGFPSSHQLKSYVASKSRLKLAARAVLSADAGLLVYYSYTRRVKPGSLRSRYPGRLTYTTEGSSAVTYMLWSEKLHYLWPPCVADADIIFMADIFALWFLSFFLLLSIFPHLISAVTDWMSTILLHRVWRWKCRTHKIAKNSPSGHHRANLSGNIFAIKARIDNRKKC